MISNCPHCKKRLLFTDTQKIKIKTAVKKLKPGNTLKFACPECKKPIEMGAPKEAEAEKKKPVKSGTAEAQKKSKGEKPAKDSPKPENRGEKKAEEIPKPINPPPPPPNPPDLSWLTEGLQDDKEVIENVPTAMILTKDEEMKNFLQTAYTKLGYQLYFPGSSAEAIEKMRFKDYEAIAYHEAFEEVPFQESVFHSHMKNLSMGKRRYIHYSLIGTGFQTLYDLEAIAYSANMVVNEKEMNKFLTILKKGKQEYDDLFGPFITTLKKYGKK